MCYLLTPRLILALDARPPLFGGGGVALIGGPVRFLLSIGGNDCLLGFELIEYEG